ncbi:MAG: hypothetical protein ACUBOA_14840 [Candidatus Loosdrechtia sp.]|uniref:hypothetical protein n=1 Tax=Candidatus Loosdrechtia sp. TaxID=3101272 RepID=UPI003A75555D|nr:MAG: hypothetical protein QY305_12965 [Candidatus Jettenia sp. AMX2]
MEEIVGIIMTKISKVSVKELENKIDTFCHLATHLKQDIGDSLAILKNELDIVCVHAEETLKNFEEIQRIKHLLFNIYEKDPVTNLKDFRRKMQKVIDNEIINVFAGFRRNEEKIISNSIKETIHRFLKQSNDIFYEFKTATEIIFEISMGQLEISQELTEEIILLTINRDELRVNLKFHKNQSGTMAPITELKNI